MEKALEIIRANKDKVTLIAEKLLEQETITAEEIKSLFEQCSAPKQEEPKVVFAPEEKPSPKKPGRKPKADSEK